MPRVGLATILSLDNVSYVGHHKRKKRILERLEVRFIGHVQGVGFRYTTLRLASRWPITGYVENQDDGSVFLVAEGGRIDLKEFLEAIQEAMSPNIRSMQTNRYAVSGEFSDFRIRR